MNKRFTYTNEDFELMLNEIVKKSVIVVKKDYSKSNKKQPKITVVKGSSSSGNFGHAGRPGKDI